jgi:YbbR domain-containing protein
VKKFFLENKSAKIIALAVAVFLWFYANDRVQKTTEFWVSFQVNAPEDIAIDYSVSNIKIKARGPQSLLEKLGHENLVYTHSVEGEVSGVRQIDVPINPERFGLPESIKVVEVRPEFVSVTLSKIITEYLPVKLDFASEPTGGSVLIEERSYAIPSVVRVTGPESVVQKGTEILTEPIYIDHLSASQLYPVPVSMRQEIDGTKVKCDKTVRVYVAIEKKMETIVLGRVPIRFLAPPDHKYTAKILDEAYLDLTVKGPPEVLSDFTEKDIFLFIDISGLEPRNVPYEEPLHCLFLKEGVTLEQELPTIKVDVPLPTPSVPEIPGE